jgi:hypothetical protein
MHDMHEAYARDPYSRDDQHIENLDLPHDKADMTRYDNHTPEEVTFGESTQTCARKRTTSVCARYNVARRVAARRSGTLLASAAGSCDQDRVRPCAGRVTSDDIFRPAARIALQRSIVTTGAKPP